MPDLAQELAFYRHIWWDPGPDGPYGPHLPIDVQKQIAAISLATRAEVLRIHAEAYGKIAKVVEGAKTVAAG